MKAPLNKVQLTRGLDLSLCANRLLALYLGVSLGAFVLVNGSALASETVGDAGASANGDAPDISTDYKLSPGDRLTIVVYDQPQLSGEFIVDGGGGVLLPLAGPVKLSGLTLAEAEKQVRDRFADGVLVQPGVSVRIKEYRPIFVTGNVRKPGRYAFMIGGSVKAAIASAGGESQAIDPPSVVAVSDLITARQRVNQLEVDHAVLLIRKARLEAQRDGRDSFLMPMPVGFSGRNVDFDRDYKAENDTFARLAETYHGQVEALQNQRPRIEAEIAGVADQIANQKDHLAIVTGRLADLDHLLSKGLVPKEVIVNQQIEKSLVESQVSSLEAQVAHLRQNVGELDVKLGEVKATYLRQTLTEYQDTTQRLRDVENSIGPAQQLLEVKARGAGVFDDPGYSVHISRVRDGGMVTFDADDETMLSPGDVVEVKLKRGNSESAPGLSAQAVRELDPTTSVAEDAQPATR
jgi:polysaccharide biosynthesis/export protein